MKVANIKPTKGISRENFIFRGILELSIWDAGGQERYLERYFSESQRPLIFSEVKTAIYMVDSTIVESRIRDVFDKFLEYIFTYSPEIDKVYVLINKIDLPNSEEDKVFKTLTDELDEEIRNKVSFTPVSVKEGSAQHRLIEILDYEIQKSTLSMQLLGKIRHSLDQLKLNTLADYLVFNQPDGLLIASTLGKFELSPLEFMKFEIGTLDSNLYSIYQTIMKILNVQNISPLVLSTVVYESDSSYVLVKEVSNGAVLMAISKNKEPEVFTGIMNILNSEDYDNLREVIQNADIKA